MKIKNKPKMNRVQMNKILFWATTLFGIIVSLFVLINVMVQGPTEMRITALITYAIITPVVALYAKKVYDTECHEWLPDCD